MAKAAETENPRYKCENVLQLELGICHNFLTPTLLSLGRFCVRTSIPVHDNLKICHHQQQKNGKGLEPKIKLCLLTNRKSALIQKLLFKQRLDYFRIVRMVLIRPMASANQISEVQVQGRCQIGQKLHQKINKDKKKIRLFPVHIPDKAQIHNFQLQGVLFENKYSYFCYFYKI